MIVLPNIYTSDIKALLDWWREIKDISEVQQSDIWNLMGRFERDLNDISVGKVK